MTDQCDLMENELKYRLGKFILTEYSSDLLMWVTNTAFGGQRSGQCLIIGNILVFLPWDRRAVGYLRLEFYINQTRLPTWNKTRNYCFALDLRQVGVAQGLAKDELEQLSHSSSHQSVNIEGSNLYRLGRYKIIVDVNSAITWKTISELGRTIGGTCIIESGILFLCPKEDEFDEGQSRLFYSELKLLPLWNTTRAWGHQESLLICEDPKLKDSTKDIWNRERMKAYIADHIPFLSKPRTQ